MKWTNKFNIDESVANAVKHDPYKRGVCDYTVSELIRPPRIHYLYNKHKDELEEDVIDGLWRVLGQSVHLMLERASTSGIAERRLYFKVDGKMVGGGMDYYHAESGTLKDYKITNCFKIKFKDYEDWTEQLNIYKYLLEENGDRVERLQIVAILRDWTKSHTKKDPEYPPKQIETIDLELWTREKTLAFIRSKIKKHEDAKVTLPVCTESERWANYKNKWTRCDNYCAVARFCDFYQKRTPLKKESK